MQNQISRAVNSKSKFHKWNSKSQLKKGGKSAHEPKALTAQAYLGFISMHEACLVEYCHSPLDGMLVHHRVTPQQYMYVAGTHFVHLGERAVKFFE